MLSMGHHTNGSRNCSSTSTKETLEISKVLHLFSLERSVLSVNNQLVRLGSLYFYSQSFTRISLSSDRRSVWWHLSSPFLSAILTIERCPSRPSLRRRGYPWTRLSTLSWKLLGIRFISIFSFDKPTYPSSSSNSLKLIKGSLDQVEEKAQITWVQPRVLSIEQIGQLSKRLEAWGERLHKVEERIAPEVLTTA